MTNLLAALSDSITAAVDAAAPNLCAIRIGPNRHVTGLLCGGDIIVTVDQALPVADGYTVVLGNRALISVRPGPREPVSNLAVLHLDTALSAGMPEGAAAPAGSVALVLGADADASPTVRLTLIRRFIRTPDGLAPELDLAAGSIQPGDAVFDPASRLIGLAALGPNGEPMAIPASTLTRVIARNLADGAGKAFIPTAGYPPALNTGRRGWLGVALQPITVPDKLVARAGQTSGRMVVSITAGGPAEKAGLRVGDVLLALNDTSTTGSHALRAFLGAERIGTGVEVRVMREGNVLTAQLIVGAQPG